MTGGPEDAEAIKAIIGSNVRSARERRRLAQTDLAQASGVAQKDVSQIELGRRNVTIETLVRLANALGTNVRRLLTQPRR